MVLQRSTETGNAKRTADRTSAAPVTHLPRGPRAGSRAETQPAHTPAPEPARLYDSLNVSLTYLITCFQPTADQKQTIRREKSSCDGKGKLSAA